MYVFIINLIPSVNFEQVAYIKCFYNNELTNYISIYSSLDQLRILLGGQVGTLRNKIENIEENKMTGRQLGN